MGVLCDDMVQYAELMGMLQPRFRALRDGVNGVI